MFLYEHVFSVPSPTYVVADPGSLSAKMYAKTKELGPVGGEVQGCPLDPPLICVTVNNFV